MGVHKASGAWNGGLQDGSGTMKPAHAGEIPFSAGSRFEGKPQSSPEELIGAALCGCFSMALTANLAKEGQPPASVRTEADVTLEKQAAGFSITQIALTSVVAGKVDAATLREVGEHTRRTCPVAKVLAGATITLRASLA
jgi:osmotically inducible protein OsmC